MSHLSPPAAAAPPTPAAPPRDGGHRIGPASGTFTPLTSDAIDRVVRRGEREPYPGMDPASMALTVATLGVGGEVGFLTKLGARALGPAAARVVAPVLHEAIDGVRELATPREIGKLVGGGAAFEVLKNGWDALRERLGHAGR